MSVVHRLASPVVLLALVFAACAGCGRAEAKREWRPTDHDQEKAPSQAAPMKPSGSTSGAEEAQDLAMVVDAAWSANCQPCHGPSGHGDGPNGAMVHAADLTAEATRSKSDSQLIELIRSGKGRMPAYPGIPQQVVAGLVAKIRSFH